jgi:hypothetical protein
MGKISELLKGKEEAPVINEADVKKLIQDLIDTPSSDENDDQGKFVQLLKGLAFSDDPESDTFMKKLMDMVSDKNFGGMTESIEE